MPAIDRRINPEVADGYPDSGDNSTIAPMPREEDRRTAKRRAADRVGGHSTNERAKADWIKDFLRS